MFYFTLAQAHHHNAPPPKHPKDGNSALSVMTNLQPTLMQLNIRKSWTDVTPRLYMSLLKIVPNLKHYYMFLLLL